MDFSARLRGINPTNTVFYSPQPRAEVYCLLMNFKISKLAYCDSGIANDSLLLPDKFCLQANLSTLESTFHIIQF